MSPFGFARAGPSGPMGQASHGAARRSLQTAWRNPAEAWWPPAPDLFLPPMIYTFGHFELDLAAVELRARRQGREPRAAGLRAARAAGREPRAPGFEGRDHREGLGRSRRLGRGGGQPRQVGAAGARRRRQVAAVHQDDPRPGVPLRRAGKNLARRAGGARLRSGARANRSTVSQTWSQRLDRISRPSLAVLPFRFVGGDERYAALANALPDELITDLARLRWLFVTARGSSFRLRAPDADFGDIGRLLRVRYCLSGTVEISNRASSSSSSSSSTRGRRRRLGRSLLGAHRRRARDARADPLAGSRGARDPDSAARSRARAPRRGRESRRLVRLPSRPATPVSLQSRRQRRGRGAVRARGCAGSDLCARARRLVVRPLPDGVHALHRRRRRRNRPARAASPSAVSSSIRSIRSSTSRWVAPTGSRAISTPAWAGSSARPTSARTTRKASTRGRGRKRCRAERADGRQHVDLAMRLSPLDPLHYAMLATRAFTHMVLGEDARSRALGRAWRALARSARADRDDCGRRARARRRHRASRVLGGERARAKRFAHARGFLPRLPDEVGSRCAHASIEHSRAPVSARPPALDGAWRRRERSLTDSSPLPDDFRVPSAVG